MSDEKTGETARILPTCGHGNDDSNNDSKNDNRKGGSVLLGALGAFLATVAGVAGIASIQLMNQVPPDFEINAFRFSTGLLVCVVYMAVTRSLPRIQREHIKWLLGVTITTIGYNLCLYSRNLKRIPIVTLFSIHQSFRIVLTMVLSKIFLKSKLPAIKLVICVVTLTGAVLTIIPRLEVYLDRNNHNWVVNRQIKTQSVDGRIQVQNPANTVSSSTPSEIEVSTQTSDLKKQNEANTLNLNKSLEGPGYNHEDEAPNKGKGYLKVEGQKENDNNKSESYTRVLPKHYKSNCDKVKQRNHSDKGYNKTEPQDSQGHYQGEGYLQGQWDGNLYLFLLSIGMVFMASLSSTLEDMIVAGSPLLHVSIVTVSFWYCLVAAILSFVVTFTLEEPFIPDNTYDVILCVIHSASVCSVTFLHLFYLRHIDVNVAIVIISLRLPLSFILEQTVLHDVITVKHPHLLLIGTVVMTVACVTMPIYEYSKVLMEQRKNQYENKS